MKEPRPTDVMSLVELQKFLADELAEVEPTGHFSRAFTPLTDGLGLESPKKKAEPVKAKPTPKPARQPLPDPTALLTDLPSTFTGLREMDDHEDYPPVDSMMAKPRPSVTAIMDPIRHRHEAPPPPRSFATKPPSSKPPPVPSAGTFRRGFAGIFDLIFLVALSALIIFISSRVTGKAAELTSSDFLKFALLEYATIAFCYFAIGIGILDVTLGMWVWGLRVAYGQDGKILKKIARVFLSLAFFGPVVPSLLLIVRINGKNLLDALSGTSLYRTTV